MSDAAAGARQPWRAWRMDEIAARTGTRRRNLPGAAGVDAPTAQLAPEERDLRAKAREAARNEGHAEGVAAGRAAGYAEGFAQGRAEGERAFDARRRELLELLVPLADNLRSALGQLDAELADALVDVALAVGHKLAGDALDAHPEQVRVLIGDLLQSEPLFSGQAQLRLHPDDAALVDAALAAQLEAAGWKVKPDAAIERGGCRLTGAEGELNATRETRWLALLARVRRHGSAPIHAALAGHAEPPR